MSTTEQLPQKRSEPFVFLLPQAPFRRVIGLVFACLFSVPPAIFIYLLVFRGPGRLPASVLLFVLVLFGLAVAFFLRLAFPPAKSLARLEFQRGQIRFTPDRVGRFLRDPVELAIPPDAQEILIRRRYSTYKVVIRRPGGHDFDAGMDLFTDFNARQASELLSGISAATGLPARLVIAQRTADDQFEDEPWKPRSAAAKWGTFGKLALGSVGLWGGALVGYFTPSLIVIAFLGLAMWLVQMLAVVAYSRLAGQYSQIPWWRWVSTLVSFGATYAAAAIFVSYQVYPR